MDQKDVRSGAILLCAAAIFGLASLSGDPDASQVHRVLRALAMLLAIGGFVSIIVGLVRGRP